MEDYTYHLSPNGQKVLGAHMLEICPTIADGQISLEVHPLGIGGKADPARLVFNSQTGPAINVSLMDMGNRFRMVVNDVDVIPPDAPLIVAEAVCLTRLHPEVERAASECRRWPTK
jgi:L-arabinose isomerase